MQKLSGPSPKMVTNAWGRDVRVIYSDYEIQESDVGNTKHHFNGYNPASYKFTRDDVGRKIREDSSHQGCWFFLTK